MLQTCQAFSLALGHTVHPDKRLQKINGHIPINVQFNMTIFNDHSCGRIVNCPIPVNSAYGDNVNIPIPVDFAVETIHELSLP